MVLAGSPVHWPTLRPFAGRRPRERGFTTPGSRRCVSSTACASYVRGSGLQPPRRRPAQVAGRLRWPRCVRCSVEAPGRPDAHKRGPPVSYVRNALPGSTKIGARRSRVQSRQWRCRSEFGRHATRRGTVCSLGDQGPAAQSPAPSRTLNSDIQHQLRGADAARRRYDREPLRLTKPDSSSGPPR
jgi:hypothetical protein